MAKYVQSSFKLNLNIRLHVNIKITYLMINNTTQLDIICKLLEGIKLLLTWSPFLHDAVDTTQKACRPYLIFKTAPTVH